MRPVLMIAVAVLLACVAYSSQKESLFDGENQGALSDGDLVREARAVSEGPLRAKRLVQDAPKGPMTAPPGLPPGGGFDEIDLTGFPLGSDASRSVQWFGLCVDRSPCQSVTFEFFTDFQKGGGAV